MMKRDTARLTLRDTCAAARSTLFALEPGFANFFKSMPHWDSHGMLLVRCVTQHGLLSTPHPQQRRPIVSTNCCTSSHFRMSYSSPTPGPNWGFEGVSQPAPLPPTNFTCLLAPVALAGDGVVAVYCCDPASWLGSICVQRAPSSVGCLWPVDFPPPVSEHFWACGGLGEPPPVRGHARPNLFSRTDAGVRSRPATPSPPQRLIARCLGEASGGKFGRGTFWPLRGAATHRSGTVSAASWGRRCRGAGAQRGAQSGLG